MDPPSNVCFFLTSALSVISSCLIWEITGFILPPNEYGGVYFWTTLGNIATDRLTEDADFGKKKIIFSHEAHFDLGEYANKQICRIWGTDNPHRKFARIHWYTADTPKTSHCLLRILVQRHNWTIFLRKRARWGRYSQWRSLSGHVERIFVHKNLRVGY